MNEEAVGELVRRHLSEERYEFLVRLVESGYERAFAIFEQLEAMEEGLQAGTLGLDAAARILGEASAGIAELEKVVDPATLPAMRRDDQRRTTGGPRTGRPIPHLRGEERRTLAQLAADAVDVYLLCRDLAYAYLDFDSTRRRIWAKRADGQRRGIGKLEVRLRVDARRLRMVWNRVRGRMAEILGDVVLPGDCNCPRGCSALADPTCGPCAVCFRPRVGFLADGPCAMKARRLFREADGRPDPATRRQRADRFSATWEVPEDLPTVVNALVGPEEFLAKFEGRVSTRPKSEHRRGRPLLRTHRRGGQPKQAEVVVGCYAVIAATCREWMRGWEDGTLHREQVDDAFGTPTRVPVLESLLTQGQIVALVGPALGRDPIGLADDHLKVAVKEAIGRRSPIRLAEQRWEESRATPAEFFEAGSTPVGRRRSRRPKARTPPSGQPQPGVSTGDVEPTRFQRLHCALPPTFRGTLWALIVRRLLGTIPPAPGLLLERYYDPAPDDDDPVPDDDEA